MLVCEAAGYDVVIVETVGVGQSETAVAGMTDMFVLLQLPNAGDDLQAIKKGVMEMADLVVINKADIDPNAATRAAGADHLVAAPAGPARQPGPCAPRRSGLAPAGDADQRLAGAGRGRLLGHRARFAQLQTANGRLAARRQQQALAWMWERIDAGLKQAFRQHPKVSEQLPALEQQVATAARGLHRGAQSACRACRKPPETDSNK
jgi:LAO/AO transport system kinase